MMKIFFKIVLISLFPLFSYSYEINFNKDFSKVVNPDLLTTYVSINVEKKDENKVNIDIEKFNNFIKSNDLVDVKNGSFTLSPKYKYYNNKQEFIGYVGSLRYNIESKEAKPLNKFIDKLILIKDKINSEDVKLNISNVSWKISEKLQNSSFDELRLESIIWINSYASSISSTLSKKCEVSKININNINRGNIAYSRSEMAYSSMAKTASDVAPVNTEENISINPNFSLECR